jgi:hypothetical protein
MNCMKSIGRFLNALYIRVGLMDHRPVSCEREFSSLQRKVSVPLQQGSAVFLVCKWDFFPFAKEFLSHDTGQYLGDNNQILLFSVRFKHLGRPTTKVWYVHGALSNRWLISINQSIKNVVKMLLATRFGFLPRKISQYVALGCDMHFRPSCRPSSCQSLPWGSWGCFHQNFVQFSP